MAEPGLDPSRAARGAVLGAEFALAALWKEPLLPRGVKEPHCELGGRAGPGQAAQLSAIWGADHEKGWLGSSRSAPQRTGLK